MHGVKEIIREAESLPVEERAFLVNSLLRTLNPPDSDLDRIWAFRLFKILRYSEH